jgi:hypothetical protein
VYCCLQNSLSLSFFTQEIKSFIVSNLSFNTLFLLVLTELHQASCSVGNSFFASLIASIGHDFSKAPLIVA